MGGAWGAFLRALAVLALRHGSTHLEGTRPGSPVLGGVAADGGGIHRGPVVLLQSPGHRPGRHTASEDDLVDIALHAPAAHVERLARGLRTADQHEPTQNAEDASRRCRTQWRWDEDTGELVFWGRLPAQDGAALLAAATRAEHEQTRTLASDTSSVGPDTGGSAEHPDLTGPPPIDLGQALVAMATITCATIAAPVHAVSAEILIHHTPHGAHLDDGPPLTSAAAQEMACGARERSVIIDDDGCILHYGRSRRTPSAAQLRALHLRDRC